MLRNNGKPMRKVASGLAAFACALAMTATGIAQTSEHAPAHGQRRVVVSIPDRKLAVLAGDTVVQIFPVAVGADVSPSPTGAFQVINRLDNPTYYHPGTVIPPGAGNPIGTRWIGLNKKGYGIHGTNVPQSVGTASSHGCIRLRNRDVERLFPLIEVGDTVEIRGERDAEIAGLFGGEGTRDAVNEEAPSNEVSSAGGGQ